MSSVKTQSLGALVLGPDGETLAASGTARNPAIARAAQAGVAALPPAENHHAGRIFDIEVDGERHIGLALLDASQQTILLRRAAAGAALFDFLGAVPFADAILEHFLTNPYQAITVVDHTGCIRFISPVHEAFFGLRTGEGTGRPAEQVIPNSRLGHVAATGKAEIGQLQRMNGVTRVVNRVPIVADGKTVGAIGQVLFKEPEAIGRMHKEVEELRSQLAHYRRELHGLRQRDSGVGLLIGESAPMQRLRREIETVARLDVPVLVLGESGTGKELVARAIHSTGRGGHGTQSDDEGTQAAPLVSLNLAAFPATLIEAELFGHAAGAFTGSHRHGQPGKLEQAAGGTLFLDEVADIPMEMQVKLLRVLEDRMVERLGSRQARRVDFRLVTATNRDIQALIDGGRFRLDLYYRLSGVVLRVPALGQRLEDIPALLHHFVQAFCQRNGVPVPQVMPDVARHLASRRWPGNVRQLRQKIEEALVFCDGSRLRVQDFARGEENHMATMVAPATHPLGQVFAPEDAPAPAAARLRDLAYDAVLQAIARHGGNKKQAALELGISRSHLYKMLERGGEA
ncbi:Transcriptional regulator containing PAS, AAA-type ATPase, and DNA-binding Fis domains [Cupriavidus sp. OV038]|jgi:transcriptional regulator with PAS, ATPase and Fis domain|uniref:sigma-54 interaction domain-containing protein n=1 Tax=unclassified Cupriavidus TaxID=2640874 RepID=UPI0008EF387B|nr:MULTISPECIES: sigma 54-interacting transcriptional regulator [unclassified Cupriavidus]SFD38281.1 Transcriptional regulator containing PAS, AAA-type ATPase, and DNA-binding Fis domains [Cupriavidus sp. OV038]SFQ08350.1 Transcriptional regulator containing PAS, AAA-type ATPase, and DNA-binding Fis domains [Cupriavidus sp. OV096]